MCGLIIGLPEGTGLPCGTLKGLGSTAEDLVILLLLPATGVFGMEMCSATGLVDDVSRSFGPSIKLGGGDYVVSC